MSFTTPLFLFIAFPCFTILYYIFKHLEAKSRFFEGIRLSDLWIVAFSWGFYGWSNISGYYQIAIYVFVVWIAGCAISKISSGGTKKAVLALGIVAAVFVLVCDKYLGFFAGLAGITNTIKFSWAVLGISFLTFSAISFLVDVYRKEAEMGSLLDVALYILFFPKVISGPIARYKDFMPQIKNKNYSLENVLAGINRMCIGFAKKLIIADYFGLVIGNMFASFNYGLDNPSFWLLTILYTLQIYYDFSGYSDIAIGLSKMVGIEIKENFDFPYRSTSITEFWRRWHISLGTWFREYLYIPLGGNRKGKTRTLINLIIVFLITGLWHGAATIYICWGCLHGICILVERLFSENGFVKKIPKAIKWLCTMLLVNIGWVAFRAKDMQEAIYIYKMMFGITKSESVFYSWEYFMGTKLVVMLVIAVLGATLLGSERVRDFLNKINENEKTLIIKEVAIFALLVIAVFCMVSSSYQPFIYFKY